jgi:translation initiation factor IF-2
VSPTSIPGEVKQQETEIIAELRKLGIQVYFKINKVDPKTKAWEHSITFQKVHTKEETEKVMDVIRKHYEKWTKHTTS